MHKQFSSKNPNKNIYIKINDYMWHDFIYNYTLTVNNSDIIYKKYI